MTETVISVPISIAILPDVQEEAQRAGVTIEHWLAKVVADRIRDKIATDRFFSRTPQPGDGQAFLAILNSTRDNPPMPGDELETWRRAARLLWVSHSFHAFGA